MSKRRNTGQYITILMLFIVVIIIYSLVKSGGSPPSPILGMATAQVGNFTTTVQTSISCTASDKALNVSFGSTNPGDVVNGTLNYYGFPPDCTNCTWYNVTNDVLSNLAINITIMGARLQSDANIIAIGNVTWRSNSTSGNASSMAYASGIKITSTDNEANKVAESLDVGSTTHLRFWLSVPSGAVAGSYTGNYTLTCTQTA